MKRRRPRGAAPVFSRSLFLADEAVQDERHGDEPDEGVRDVSDRAAARSAAPAADKSIRVVAHNVNPRCLMRTTHVQQFTAAEAELSTLVESYLEKVKRQIILRRNIFVS